MSKRWVERVTDKKSVRALFLDSPQITLVGYWWMLPPSMGESRYLILQKPPQRTANLVAANFALVHGGHTTPETVSPEGVLTYRVILPLPVGEQAANTYVRLGRKLYTAMMNAIGQ